MNVISRPTIIEAQRKHAHCRKWLDAWWRAAKLAHWVNLTDVRLTYPTADQVGNLLVFDAPEARRLIVGVRYESRDPPRGGTLFVKHLLTHAEYDRGDWKGE